MRPIDADKLIEERFSVTLSAVQRDGEGRNADTLPQRIKASIAEQLTHFLLCEGKKPEDVRVLVRYPGMLAVMELEVDIREQPGELPVS